MLIRTFQRLAQWVGFGVIAGLALYGLVTLGSGRLWAADTVPTVAATLLAPAAPQAAIPSTFNYQGFLRNPDGSLVSGTHTITLKIYDQASGGNLLHQEPFSAVPVRDGLFNVVLGDGVPLPATLFTANAPLFIGVSVNADPELIPRQRVHPVPWALQSTTLVPNATVQGLNLTGSTRIGDSLLLPRGDGGVEVQGANFMFANPGAARFYVDSTGVTIYQHANIFGNATIGGNATVKGKGVVVGEESNLRIVRGKGTANTTVGVVNGPWEGAGYTWKKISQGVVDVTFDSPFSGVPTVTANPVFSGAIFVGLQDLGGGGNPGPTGFRAVMYDTAANGRDWPFNFIAIGPR